LGFAFHQAVNGAQGKAFEEIVAERFSQFAERIESGKVAHGVISNE
jgi:hypothetical protein